METQQNLTEVQEKKSDSVMPGTYLTGTDKQGNLTLQEFSPYPKYPDIYLNGYVEKTPNPGGGESVFFG